MLIDRLATLTGLAVVTLFLAQPASALTMAECSTKYNAAKDAGTLAGQTWNQFRKAQCGTDASAATDTTKPAQKAKANADDTSKPAKKAAAASDDAKGLTAKECSAKYQAAKAAGTLNGMKWNDFRKAQCGPGASAAVDTTAAPAKPAKAATKAADAAAGGKGLTMAECSTSSTRPPRAVVRWAARSGTISARPTAAPAPMTTTRCRRQTKPPTPTSRTHRRQRRRAASSSRARLRRNILLSLPARRACTPASISTTLPRTTTPSVA